MLMIWGGRMKPKGRIFMGILSMSLSIVSVIGFLFPVYLWTKLAGLFFCFLFACTWNSSFNSRIQTSKRRRRKDTLREKNK